MKTGNRRSKKAYGSGDEEGESEIESASLEEGEMKTDDGEFDEHELEDELMSDSGDDVKVRGHRNEDLTLRHRAVSCSSEQG